MHALLIPKRELVVVRVLNHEGLLSKRYIITNQILSQFRHLSQPTNVGIRLTTIGHRYCHNHQLGNNTHNISNPINLNLNSNHNYKITISKRFQAGIKEHTSDDKSLPPGVLSHTVLSPVSKSVSNIAKLPIITMHGLFGFKANLRAIVANSSINSDRTVITVDLRNHGDSFHSDEMSLDCMSKDIGKTMDYLEIKHAVLLGHSLGGRVAMTSALYDPRRIKGIIVADVAPVDYQGYKIELYYRMIDVFKNLPTKDYFDKRSDALNYVASLLPELTELELNFLMASFVQNQVCKGIVFLNFFFVFCDMFFICISHEKIK